MSSRRRADPSAIDEALIRELIGGHTPALLPREGPLAAPPPRIEPEPTDAPNAVSVATGNYTELFLQPGRIKRRACCYVGWETKRKLELIVRCFDQGNLSLSALIDNILTHHLTTYRNEINEMIKNANKPI